jgi:hypothetical protein
LDELLFLFEGFYLGSQGGDFAILPIGIEYAGYKQGRQESTGDQHNNWNLEACPERRFANGRRVGIWNLEFLALP